MLYIFKAGFTRVVFLFFLTFIAMHLRGQIQHINFRHYSLEDGLSSYKVVKVLQDRFGFMWIATQDGLNRFDGKDIIIYNKSSNEKHLLAGSDITDIAEDTSRNILWVISSYGGLNGIDLKTGNVTYTVRVTDTASHFSHDWLKCMTIYKNELWIGTFDGISVFNPDKGGFGKKVSIPFRKTTKKNYDFDINQFYIDEYDRVWTFIANYGLVIYSGIDQSVVAFYDLPALHLQDVYVYKRFFSTQGIGQGQMLLATHLGIKRITYNSTDVLKIADEKIAETRDKEIHSLELDRDSNLWFATGTGLFMFNLKSNNFSSIKEVKHADQKKWLASINSIFSDRQDNLWLGTLHGFAMAPTTKIVFLNHFQSPDQKTRINRAWFIFPYNDSVEYVCAEDGFYRVDNSPDNITQLKKGMLFLFMLRHIDGNLIVGAEDRVFIFRPPDHFIGIEEVYPELSFIKNETINSAVYWRDSLLFIGSEASNGVYEWDYKMRNLKKIGSEPTSFLKSSIVNALYKDKTDKIWILSDNSFARYDPINSSVENYELRNPATGQPLNLFFDVCETSDSYWLASYGSGIIQLDKNYQIKRIISTNQGIANAGIYKLFPVDDTLLYATSNNGLCRINTHNFSVSNYFESDGLHSNAFEEFCGIEKKGKIYAGGPNGFTIIDTKSMGSNTSSPELYIYRVSIETKTGLTDTSNLFLRSVRLPKDVLQATVHFSGINYLNPGRTTFAYRIKEQHDEWISLGNQNTLSVFRLPPGTYTLQVKAANEEGVWSAPVELKIIFLPKWYQTWWFFTLIGFIVLSGIYSLYKYRLAQVIKFYRLRTKISQDLHDEVGSSLSGIGLMSEMAKQQLENEKITETKNSLDKISVISGEVLAMMSDIVWAINPRNDTFEKMIMRLKMYAKSITNPDGVLLHFKAEQDLQRFNLSMQRRKNIYLICKEAINNAIRYSECKNLYFLLRRNDYQFYISIRDDGKGFNVQEANDGNGLSNMQARALEIKASLKIDSEKDKGTSILLLLRIT